MALATVILGFAPGLLDPFNAPKAAVLRLFGLPLLVWALVDAAVRRAAPAARWPRILDLAVLCWLAASSLSAVFGISPRLSLHGEIQQREGLLTVLALGGLYFAARRAHRRAAEARSTIHVVFGSAGLAAAYAMLQRAGLDPLAWTAVATYPAGDDAVLRPFGTAGNAVLLGGVLAPAFAACLAFALAPRQRAPWRLAALILIGAATAATLSRGALLALIGGAAVAAVVSVRTLGPGAAKRAAFVLASVFGVVAAWSAFALRAPLAARAAETLNPHAESAPARIEIAKSALAMWAHHPWLGVGPDAFGLAFPAWQTAALWRNGWIGIPAHAHSVPLQVLATGGALTAAAGALWIAALLIVLRPGAGRTDDADEVTLRIALLSCVAALWIGGGLNPVGLAGAAVFVVCSALAANLAQGSPASEKDGPLSPRAVTALVAALIVAAVVALPLAGELRGLAAANRAHHALLAAVAVPPGARSGPAHDAGRWAATATEHARGEDELWRLRTDAALAGLAASSGPGARDSLAADALASARVALALEPERAANLQRLGNALSARGEWAAADSAFDAANRRAPFDGLPLLDRYRSELLRGSPERALETARRIVELYPEEATGHAVEAGAWLALGRREEARRALAAALAARWDEDAGARREAARRFLRGLEADSVR